MFEGFLFGMLLWAGPAALGWIIGGPIKLVQRLRNQH